MVDLQNIEEELKTKIKEAGVENKVLREKNAALEKKLVQSPVPHLAQYQGSFGGQILSLTFEGKLSIIKSNIGEEGAITLGPWGGSEGGYWAYKLDAAPIMQITLGYGLVIDSILITSKSCDGNVIGCSDRFGGPGGEYTATLCIDTSVEQLLSISLTYGDISGMRLITSLSFYSNRGKYGPYGMVFGSPVSIPVEDAVLAGFHGRGGLYLDAFGVIVAPKVLNSSHKASGSGLRLEEI
ncbi:mannose/glucose-specific lectin-like [Rhododendron vialii]|uniref:mannose/glucose-specific lectin-like n=1 Tax=Rhododendron vialii TaxID=182163 RepID=UPI00265FDB1E|nr:mannose/glucose-specific lectin-like [Rhododendron vialii]